MLVIIIGAIETPPFYNAVIIPIANPKLSEVTKKHEEAQTTVLKIVKEIPIKAIEKNGPP